MLIQRVRSSGSPSDLHGPGTGYKTLLGGILCISSLVALACASSSVAFTDDNLAPFNTSYGKFLVATNVLACLTFSIFLVSDLINQALEPRLLFYTETILLVFSFSGSCAATVHFGGSNNYCSYRSADQSHCTTYQAAIFFSWLVFFTLCLKVYVSSLSSRGYGGRAIV